MGLLRKEYQSGLPFPPAGDLPDPGIKLASLKHLTLAGRFFITSTTWGDLVGNGTTTAYLSQKEIEY